MKNPTTSVTVVTNTVAARAGSTPIRLRPSGIKIPENPAATMLTIIAARIISAKPKLPNQKYAPTPQSEANTTPLIRLTMSSLLTSREILDPAMSHIASALTLTVSACVPALPPSDATMGIRIANATIYSIVPPNIENTIDATTAVSRLNSNQTERPRTMSKILS